jgi:hypothetical protein
MLPALVDLKRRTVRIKEQTTDFADNTDDEKERRQKVIRLMVVNHCINSLFIQFFSYPRLQFFPVIVVKKKLWIATSVIFSSPFYRPKENRRGRTIIGLRKKPGLTFSFSDSIHLAGQAVSFIPSRRNVQGRIVTGMLRCLTCRFASVRLLSYGPVSYF